ncbi:PepSY domain-containing protein [Aerosticca soli]|uniref:Iron-regulated membrane protein n=1 Tax=Aerosticca soli TaxID=2010829 RepID=A0A2Z6E5P6_9GAMM|nr:PepSY domain-containing protein [Aerosticca soli]BBD79789.1 hypothetical protein ALSL_1127 [Aerosticca soli]
MRIRVLAFARLLHLYLGVFSAPMLLFFAITGGLQTYDLHMPAKDGGYQPPAWLASLGMLHKKQFLAAPRRPPSEAKPASGEGDRQAAASRPRTEARTPPARVLWPMKLFFALISFALALSVATGVYLAYRYTRRPWRVSAIVLAGIVVPVLLACL